MTAAFLTDPLTLRFFLLLLAGHVLSDFLFQTARIARDKDDRTGALLLHGLWTAAVQAAAVFPFWSPPVLLGVLALTAAHVGIDWLKPRLPGDLGRTLTGFTLDQGLHLVTLLGLTGAMAAGGGLRLVLLDSSSLDGLVRALVVVAGFAFNGKGGTAVVRLLLGRFPEINEKLRETQESAYAMGRVIGNLERITLYLLVLLDQWGAIGFVVAAKSIARFKELDQKGFADYYLVGTLASVLVALVSGAVVERLFDML
jgi:hypothetical protein